MSQLIACKHKSGIVLAADSKAVDVDASGNVVEYSISRLTPLTDHTVILCGGAAVGESMAKALKAFVAEEKLDDVEAVFNSALPFLASEYSEAMRKACTVQPLDPVHQVHFIIAGHSTRDPQNPFKTYFLWTKRKLPQLDGDEIIAAFTVPRVIRLEHRLSRLASENAESERLEALIREAMPALAEKNEEVGGPFVYAVISRQGLKMTKDSD
jgi:20S proteasome alpha/beta subunit